MSYDPRKQLESEYEKLESYALPVYALMLVTGFLCLGFLVWSVMQ